MAQIKGDDPTIERTAKLIDLLLSGRGLTYKDIEERFNVSNKTARRYLNNLALMSHEFKNLYFNKHTMYPVGQVQKVNIFSGKIKK